MDGSAVLRGSSEISSIAAKVSFTYILCLSLQIGEKLRLEEQRNSSAIIRCSVAKFENFSGNFAVLSCHYKVELAELINLHFPEEVATPAASMIEKPEAIVHPSKFCVLMFSLD